jgi:hypothetical protein
VISSALPPRVSVARALDAGGVLDLIPGTPRRRAEQARRAGGGAGGGEAVACIVVAQPGRR